MTVSNQNHLIMARIAREFCHMIESLDSYTHNVHWIRRFPGVLSNLQAAVAALQSSTNGTYFKGDPDDSRCELFMRINEFLLSDEHLWPDFDRYELKLNMCENLAFDFTDIYFDLKRGLNLLHHYPNQPEYANASWRSSFYFHWGQQLLDAQGWLHAVSSSAHIPHYPGYRNHAKSA